MNSDIDNLHNLEEKIINSAINQYFDISDITNNIIINHVIDEFEPLSIIITANCDKSDVILYFKVDNDIIVKKQYDGLPLIVNTTNAKIVLLNYSIDFTVNNSIDTCLLANKIHAIYNSKFTIRANNLVRYDTYVKTTCVEYNNFDNLGVDHIDIKKLKRHMQLFNTVLLNDNTLNDKNINDITHLLKLDSKMQCDMLNDSLHITDNNKTDINGLLPNGLLIDHCSDGIYDSFVNVIGNIEFNDNIISGLIVGYCSKLQNMNVIIDGNVTFDTCYISGVLSGVSKYLSKSKLTINGKLTIKNSEVIGLFAGSSIGIYHDSQTKINELNKNNVNVFGSIIGYLSQIISIDTIKSDDSFVFDYELFIDNKLVTEYDCIGDINILPPNILLDQTNKRVIKSTDNTIEQTINTKTDINDSDISLINVDNTNSQESNDKNTESEQSQQSSSVCQCSSCNESIEECSTECNCSDTKTIKQTEKPMQTMKQNDKNYHRNTTAWQIFDLIKSTRQNIGLECNNFITNKKIPKNNKENFFIEHINKLSSINHLTDKIQTSEYFDD